VVNDDENHRECELSLVLSVCVCVCVCVCGICEKDRWAESEWASADVQLKHT
jgi:hypothetical protein